jgi:uncharacterized membrane protein YbhN (UPF0104 family)
LPPSPSDRTGPSAAPPRRPAGRRLAALLLAAAVLAAVIAAAGPAAVADALARTDGRLVAVALLVVQVQTLASAWRWSYTAARLGVTVPLGRAYLEYALAGLVNGTLPGGVAGDVLRAVRVVGTGAAVAPAVRSVVIERLAGQVSFWLVAAAGLILLAVDRGDVPGGAMAALVAVPVLAAIAVATTVLLARRGPRRVRAALLGLGPDVARATLRDGALAVQLTLGIAVAASYVAVFALASAAVGAPLTVIAAVSIIPLALLAMLVPVGIGGWGLREGAAAVLWPLAGHDAAEGVAAGALYGILVVVGGLPGLLALVPRPPTGPSGKTA